MINAGSDESVRHSEEAPPLPASLALPSPPMSPLLVDRIPEGADWLHQLKWDGVRIMAQCHCGQVRLFSKRLLEKTAIFGEVTATLERCAALARQSVLLDGEVVVFDPMLNRPSFPLVLQRERTRSLNPRHAGLHATYVVFDVLGIGEQDLRPLPYEERHHMLTGLLPEKSDHCFVADAFSDGASLWEWVKQHEWEGVVSKRKASPYVSGKQHRDWYKNKKDVQLDGWAVGFMLNGKRPASVVLADEQLQYIGKASIGLDETHRQLLLAWAAQYEAPAAGSIPASLKREPIVWFRQPIPIRVSALEYTPGGQLRHPRVLLFPLLERPLQ
ncbi:ATP-dependent DNA ligase [Paenibacillus apiarius]|uniref:DNA ligase n=1 Tax=Paenibacillus apiarius TaxID=46240 RepID=A0ABT4DUV2_9BACL|nr:DNA ligase [Paenibacillus apiarius]MCY9516428.1 DNA ligase [Paenibacillus apiarius]MCY9521112.1 DNA ligase [Paenibacillus apiarius]MCY9551959.1 DNA ligase [Paenibacillus apiarius]MCY9560904.1 DNA ligase [Paenibacillus apiarius]MCY9684533.1 DNA ligase [Paenibacillus apiarius]